LAGLQENANTKFLVSFSEAGELMVSKAIPPSDQQKLGLAAGMRLLDVCAAQPLFGFSHSARP